MLVTYIVFEAPDEDSAERFIRDYVLDAIDRVNTADEYGGLDFALNEPAHPDGGSIGLSIAGDVDRFVDDERQLWERYEESGLINGWKRMSTLDRETASNLLGERGAELGAHRLRPLVARMGRLAYEEFDQDEGFPAAVDTFPDEDSLVGVGWAYILHHLAFANLGYSAADEIDMHMFGIEEDLRIVAERSGEEAVDEQVDSLIVALNEMREDVKKGRPEP